MKNNVTTILALFFQLAFALTQTDVTHNPQNIFYVNPQAGQLKVRIRKDNASTVMVAMNEIMTQCVLQYQDDTYDYFVGHVEPFDSTSPYYFLVKSTTDSLRVPETAEFSSRVSLFQTPLWAQGKVYYSIYPDGFYNGDVINDPAKKLPWGSSPREGQSYGGDLRGILQKVPYIDSLGIDIVLLQPIFPSSSNHKYDVKDFATVDIAFGDTTILRNLINELHRRNKYIVLSIPFTHTGTEFPTFADIIKNGASSRYTDWYMLASAPITTSPPDYACWRDDWRFPKLNLKNPQVANYLTGYLEYWKHFGFDGFYIGEDEKTEPAFVKTLRTHIKNKYPDCLLLGSDPRMLTSTGFDGCTQYAFTDVIVKYFVNQTISTSEFDRWIRRLFFFNPAQTNNTNLINLSVYGSRIQQKAQPGALRNLYAFIFTCMGSPVLLYGDEIRLTTSVPLNAGCFPWNVEDQDRMLLDEIKKLIAIHRVNPQISGNLFYTLYANDITRVYAYDRGGLITVLNSGNSLSYVELPAWDGTYVDLVTSDTLTAFSQKLRLSVEPMTYRILRREI